MELEKILEELDRNPQLEDKKSQISKIFDILKATFGVTEENYLAWGKPFVIGTRGEMDFPAESLSHPIMWGIVPRKRPFVVFAYTYFREGKCPKYETLTLFQPFRGNNLEKGGFFRKLSLEPNCEDFYPLIERLFKGEEIVQEKRTLTKSSQKELKDVYYTISLVKEEDFERSLVDNLELNGA